MKSSLLKKGIVLVLIMSMVFTFSTTSFAAELSHVRDDQETYSTAEMEQFNAENQTKEEAVAESKQLDTDNPLIKPSASLPVSALYASLPTSASSATSITGSTPYFTGNYTLTAGTAGYVKLTPSQSYYTSVYTTGSTDTYLEVYSDLACTNLIASNDDNGHGTNALVFFFANSGQTYYIKLRGYSTSTSGDYFFVLHRGQPTSRSEKGDMFTTYNSTTYKTYNNCYTYALTYYVNPITGSKFRYNGQNPGEMSGNAITINDLADAATAKTKIEAAMTRDFSYFGGDWAEITYSDQPRAGYFKVALVLAPGVDYHWYRQIPNGNWTHKPGSTSAIDYDNSNYLIYHPDTCNRNYPNLNYSDFIGYYEIKVPAGRTSALSGTFSTEAEVVYPINKNLTLEDVKALSSGTSFEEAMDVLGEPHGYAGSGMIGSVYELADGSKITVYYANGNIDQIRTYHEDGTFEIIVQ